MMINYDVAIIGAGPAGLFAAHYILTHSAHATIVETLRQHDGKSILRSSDGESFSATNVIFSVGKTGSNWMKRLFTDNGIAFAVMEILFVPIIWDFLSLEDIRASQ